MLRILFGLFLMAHGLIHASYLTRTPSGAGPSWPFDLSRSALLGALGEPTLRILGTGLAAATIATFLLAGIAFLWLGTGDGWVPLAIAGSVASHRPRPAVASRRRALAAGPRVTRTLGPRQSSCEPDTNGDESGPALSGGGQAPVAGQLSCC
jgi:hypothetical protein